MGIEITNVDKVEQKLKFCLPKGSVENADFLDVIQKWLNTNAPKQTIDGSINRIKVESYGGEIEINIISLKEDRLKLLQ